jgi:hypothetical protein
MAGPVDVDVVGDGGAVGILAVDGAIEDVEVLPGIRRGGIGAGNFEDVAEFGEEHQLVRRSVKSECSQRVMKESIGTGGVVGTR